MKNLKSILSLALVVSVAWACGPKGSTVETSDAKEVASSDNATTLSINTEASHVTWIGSKPGGKHNGTIDITSGNISLDGDKIVAGTFTIDITTVTDLDMAGSGGQAKLETHLKSADFFDVANHPTAMFEVTGVTEFEAASLESDNEEFDTENTPAKLSEILVENPTHFISGNLTMRGTTLNITIPAHVELSGNTLKANANFNIDRTQWGLMYQDESSVADKAKDKFIYNTVSVGFQLEAGTTTSME